MTRPTHRVAYYPNRTLCDVLDEMRKCCATLNFGHLPGLIEEAQSFGNRMEAALGDAKDIKRMNEQRSALKKELQELVAKIETEFPETAEKDDEF